MSIYAESAIELAELQIRLIDEGVQIQIHPQQVRGLVLVRLMRDGITATGQGRQLDALKQADARLKKIREERAQSGG